MTQKSNILLCYWVVLEMGLTFTHVASYSAIFIPRFKFSKSAPKRVHTHTLHNAFSPFSPLAPACPSGFESVCNKNLRQRRQDLNPHKSRALCTDLYVVCRRVDLGSCIDLLFLSSQVLGTVASEYPKPNGVLKGLLVSSSGQCGLSIPTLASFRKPATHLLSTSRKFRSTYNARSDD